MKKIMIGVLVLIPIIIVLIVGLVTNFVSTQVHIGVDSVTLDKTVCYINLAELKVDASGAGRLLNLKDHLTVEVLPEKATNRDALTWSIDGEVVSLNPALDTSDADLAYMVEDVDGTYVAAQSNSTGLMMIKDYCHFTVTVQAEQHKASCLIEITDAEVQAISVSGKNTLSVGESTLLTARYSPLGSLVTTGTWESDNPSVAKVDANGIVTAVAAGSANITMTTTKASTGEPVQSPAFRVTVNPSVTLFGTTVNVAGNSFDLSSIGVNDGGATATGGTLAGGTFTFEEGVSSATLTLTGGAKVTLVKCASDDFVIENADIIAYDAESESSYIVALNGIPLKLSAVWQADVNGATGTPSVTWASLDENIAKIDQNGVVTPVSNGKVTISATAGGKQQFIEIFVAKKTDMLNLAMTDENLKVGLALETVFASQKFDAEYNLVPNTVTIETVVPEPTGDSDFYNDFVFTVTDLYDDKDIAYFEGNVLTFIPENITERTTVTVTVKAKYPRYPDMAQLTQASVTLNVVSGVSVTDTEQLFRAAPLSRDFEKYSENGTDKYREVTPAVKAIVMNSDIEIKANSTAARTPEICCDFYGNGHNLYSTKAFVGDTGMDLIYQYGDNTTISNVVLTTNKDIGDEITDAEGAKGLRGYGVSFNITPGDRYGEDETRHTVRMEYSIVENAGTGIGLSGVDFYLDGCIIRNMGGTGIYVATNLNEYEVDGQKIYGTKYSIIHTNNVVMSNLIGTAMSFHFTGFASKNQEVADKENEAGHVSGLVQTGFLDIYNWQPITALNLIDKNTIDSSLGNLVDLASSAIGDALTDPKFSNVVKQYNGETYVHMGFISVGITEKSYLEPQFVTEEGRYREITTNDFIGNSFFDMALTIMPPIKDNPIRVWCYYANDSAITPGKTYVINAKFIERLHQA